MPKSWAPIIQDTPVTMDCKVECRDKPTVTIMSKQAQILTARPCGETVRRHRPCASFPDRSGAIHRPPLHRHRRADRHLRCSSLRHAFRDQFFVNCTKLGTFVRVILLPPGQQPCVGQRSVFHENDRRIGAILAEFANENFHRGFDG